MTQLYQQAEMTVEKIRALFQISKPTFYAYLKNTQTSVAQPLMKKNDSKHKLSRKTAS